ncbi:MAG TPA: metallophosphoesterase family protein [Candidatus Eisenbacteria bacterium]|jgi:putative phosphoesterase|nr:metallophosphoesterase family protein [Candidatus Eisenbacteria bacterium]
MRIGVLSDTHGLLRPEAIDALRGSEQIVHAGDVGDAKILDVLRAIAPLTAVRGNVDGDLASLLPKTAMLRAGDIAIYVHHGNDRRNMEPPPGTDVVISGHTHEPRVEEVDGVLHLNPGSAGPRRFHLPVTVAILTVDGGRASARIVPLLS